MKRAALIVMAIAVLAFSLAYAADVVYVKSMKADIKASPSFKAKTVITAGKGTVLNVAEKKGNWYKVSYGDKSGWVTAILVDSNPPMKRVSVFTEQQEDLSKGARRRASQVTSAAAARGLTDEDRKRLGQKGMADYASLEKVENVEISEGELSSFSGGLK